MGDRDVTYGVPRFLAVIELAYLREAMLAAFQVLERKRSNLESSEQDKLGNLNATDQALRRAFFISSFAILEQNLDEVVSLAGQRLGKRLKPADLREGGVKGSLRYAEKVLGSGIDTGERPWQDLLSLQKLRNHLIHYGSGFKASGDHHKRPERFEKISGVQLRPMICFEDGALDKYLELFVECVSMLTDSLPDLPPEQPPEQ